MKKLIPKNALLVPKDAKKVFEGQIFSVYQWQQKMFDDSYQTFEMLKRPDTVAIIPVKDNKLVAIKELQPNWPAEIVGFPSGRMDKDNESPLQAAQRELLEETGLSFSNWKLLKIDQREMKIEWFVYTFLAYGKWQQQASDIENGERIEVRELDFVEAKKQGKDDIWLGEGYLNQFSTIDDLLATPEADGVEYEDN